MKHECFRLASAFTSASPFKSSVATAHTVEAISMHLPGSFFSHWYGWCLYTNGNGNMFSAPCSIHPSALPPSLSQLWKYTYYSLLEWSWLHHPRQNEVAETVIFTIASCVYLRLFTAFILAKKENVFHENGVTSKSTPQMLLHQGCRKHSTKISQCDGNKCPNHSVGSTCPFYF